METETTSKALRMSVFQFRTRYFAEGARPSKKTVEQWITKGTREKVFLRANRFDGEYFITIGDAEAFLRATTARPQSQNVKASASPTHKQSMEYLRSVGFDI